MTMASRRSSASSVDVDSDGNIIDMSTATRSGRFTTRLRSLSRGRRNNSIPRGRNRSLSISRKSKTTTAATTEGYTLDWSKKGGSSKPLGRSFERGRNRSLSISRRSSSKGGYAILDGKSMSVGESSTSAREADEDEDDRLTQMMTAEIERVLEERRVSDDIKKKTIHEESSEHTIQKLKRRLSKMESKLQTQNESQTEEVNKWKERFFHSCDQLEKMASKAEVQNKSYMKQVNDISTTHAELVQQVDHYKIENCELLAKCDRLSHKCDRLEVSESKLMEERTRERQVYGDICEENEILQESVEEAMQLVNSMGKKMTSFVEAHESCVQDYENKLASLRDELETEKNQHTTLPTMEESSSSSSSSCTLKETEKDENNLHSEIARLNTENEEAYEALTLLEQEIELLRNQAKTKTTSKSRTDQEEQEEREQEDQIIKADRTLQQDLMSILLNNPSEVKSLSSNTGPCHICNNENHPTLRCSFLNATRIPSTIHHRLKVLQFKEENGLHTLKLKEGNVIVDIDRICSDLPSSPMKDPVTNIWLSNRAA